MRRWPVALVVILAVLLAGLGAAMQRGAPSGGTPAPAAGHFDHYLLAVTWMPGWCQTTGDARDDARCDPGTGRGWSLHGLWPQHQTGWPEFCQPDAAAPTVRDIVPVEPIMGSRSLALHQWRKHGTCTGLTAAEYFLTSRAAWDRLSLPDQPPASGAGRILPADLAVAFAAANPGLDSRMLAVSCRDNRLQEVRLCLSRDLEWRSCGADVLARACRSPVQADPVR